MDRNLISTESTAILSYFLSKSRSYSSKVSDDYLKNRQNCKISSKDRESHVCKISSLAKFKSGSARVELLAVCYSDLFLCHKQLPSPACLDLIAFVSVNLALKYEESREITMSEFETFSSSKFPLELVQVTEMFLVDLMSWDLNLATPIEFLSLFFGGEWLREGCERVQQVAWEAVCYAARDYSLWKNPAEVVAVAAIGLACQVAGLASQDWLGLACKSIGGCDESVKNLIKDLGDLFNSSQN